MVESSAGSGEGQSRKGWFPFRWSPLAADIHITSLFRGYGSSWAESLHCYAVKALIEVFMVPITRKYKQENG
jgi:hypothetical protein